MPEPIRPPVTQQVQRAIYMRDVKRLHEEAGGTWTPEVHQGYLQALDKLRQKRNVPHEETLEKTKRSLPGLIQNLLMKMHPATNLQAQWEDIGQAIKEDATRAQMLGSWAIKDDLSDPSLAEERRAVQTGVYKDPGSSWVKYPLDQIIRSASANQLGLSGISQPESGALQAVGTGAGLLGLAAALIGPTKMLRPVAGLGAGPLAFGLYGATAAAPLGEGAWGDRGEAFLRDYTIGQAFPAGQKGLRAVQSKVLGRALRPVTSRIPKRAAEQLLSSEGHAAAGAGLNLGMQMDDITKGRRGGIDLEELALAATAFGLAGTAMDRPGAARRGKARPVEGKELDPLRDLRREMGAKAEPAKEPGRWGDKFEYSGAKQIEEPFDPFAGLRAEPQDRVELRDMTIVPRKTNQMPAKQAVDVARAERAKMISEVFARKKLEEQQRLQEMAEAERNVEEALRLEREGVDPYVEQYTRSLENLTREALEQKYGEAGHEAVAKNLSGTPKQSELAKRKFEAVSDELARRPEPVDSKAPEVPVEPRKSRPASGILEGEIVVEPAPETPFKVINAPRYVEVRGTRLPTRITPEGKREIKTSEGWIEEPRTMWLRRPGTAGAPKAKPKGDQYLGALGTGELQRTYERGREVVGKTLDKAFPLRRLSDEAKRTYRQVLVGPRDYTAHASELMFESIDKQVLAPAVKRIKAETPRLRSVDRDWVMSVVYEYGAPGQSGRPGVKRLKAEVAKAKDLTAKEAELFSEAVKILERPDRYPEVFRAVDEMGVMFADVLAKEQQRGHLGKRFPYTEGGDRGLFKTQRGAQKFADKMRSKEPERNPKVEKSGDGWVVTGEVGALPEGMNYLPHYGERAIPHRKTLARQARTKRANLEKSPLATSKSYQQRRHVRGGTAERMLQEGTTAHTYNLAKTFADHWAVTERLKVSRDYTREILGSTLLDKQTGKRLPTAIEAGTIESLPKDIQAEVAGRYEAISEATGFKGPGGKQVLVHPELAPLLKRVSAVSLYSGNMPAALKAWGRLNQVMKAAKLTFSPFHYWALAINDLAYARSPIEARKNYDKLVRHPLIKEAIEKGGLTMGGASSDFAFANRGYNAVFGEQGIYSRGLFKPLRKVESIISREMWHKMYRGSKAISYMAALEANLRRGMPREEAVQSAAQQINSLHGGINWNWHGISNTLPQWLSLFMLAPDWQVSNWTWSLNAAFGRGKSNATNRMALVRYAAGAFIFGNMVNRMTSGQWMWENDEGHRHHVQIGQGRDTYYLDILGHMGETWRALIGLMNEYGADIPEGRRAFSQYVVGKSAALPRAIQALTSGQTMYPPDRALPGISEIMEGKPEGRFGQRNRKIDALFIEAAKQMSPIVVENIFDAMVEHELDLEKVIQDPQVLSGLVGRHIYKKYRKRR